MTIVKAKQTTLQKACAARKEKRHIEHERMAEQRRWIKTEKDALRKDRMLVRKMRDEAEHALFIAGASQEKIANIKHISKVTESIRQRAKKEGLTHARLRELIHYDPVSGEMYRTAHVQGNVYDPPRLIKVTPRSDGYMPLYIAGVRSFIHRFAFFYMTGAWPAEIDHINHDKGDNSWVNLRECGRADNHKNKKIMANNISGTVGVAQIKKTGNWQAKITTAGNIITIGTFPSRAQAIAARMEAEKKYKFHENNGLSKEALALL